MKMTASERMMKWIRDNPEKAAALKARENAKRIARQDAAIAAHQASEYKTPMAAIRGFCRRCAIDCVSACPLFAFRYGDPAKIARGRRENNIAVVHTPNSLLDRSDPSHTATSGQ